MRGTRLDQPGIELKGAPRDTRESQRVDVEYVAQLVYEMMLRDLAIERERGGWTRAI
jgi:hypothetical protein